MNPRTEILLFQASRAQLVEQVIRPHLAKGGVVLSDRYADSTLAYQGYGHQMDIQPLKALVTFATGGLKPDLTILLDVDVEEGLQRKKKNNAEWNRMADHAIQFYQRVRAGYLVMVKQEPNRWVVVDSGQKWESVQAELRKVIMERIKAK